MSHLITGRDIAVGDRVTRGAGTLNMRTETVTEILATSFHGHLGVTARVRFDSGDIAVLWAGQIWNRAHGYAVITACPECNNPACTADDCRAV